MMSTLLLRLAGPLQAWGTESRFNVRQAGTAPSKSGVVGLLAAALGRRRDSDLADLRQLRFGVRSDWQGKLLRDYQIVRIQDEKDNTKIKETNVTERYYLADAVFVAGLESEDLSFLQSLEAALRAPVWAPFLGRRSCPPTQPLVLGIREKQLYKALCDEPWQASDWQKKKWLSGQRHRGGEGMPKLSILLDADAEAETDEYGRAAVQDKPISFDQRNRSFEFRIVKSLHPVTPPDVKAIITTPGVYSDGVVYSSEIPTEHDAFAEMEGL